MVFNLLPSNLSAQTNEGYLKAVILWKTTQYIEWPEDADINDKSTPFTIGVIGENPFGTALQDLYLSGGQKIKGKPVEIIYVYEFNQIDQCDILFISASEKKNLEDILTYTKDKAILTIGDTKKYGVNGVHINFYISMNKTRFELNESSIAEEGFKVDYHLRNIAKLVGSRKGETQ